MRHPRGLHILRPSTRREWFLLHDEQIRRKSHWERDLTTNTSVFDVSQTRLGGDVVYIELPGINFGGGCLSAVKGPAGGKLQAQDRSGE